MLWELLKRGLSDQEIVDRLLFVRSIVQNGHSAICLVCHYLVVVGRFWLKSSEMAIVDIVLYHWNPLGFREGWFSFAC